MIARIARLALALVAALSMSAAHAQLDTSGTITTLTPL